MAERIEWRGNPAALWPEAKSIIMLADNYSPKHDPMEILNYSDHGAISVYAQNQDYHELVKKKLKRFEEKKNSSTQESSPPTAKPTKAP